MRHVAQNSILIEIQFCVKAKGYKSVHPRLKVTTNNIYNSIDI